MLVVTGVLIAAVLVTMVGSTVHTLQWVGWAPITPIRGLEGLPYWFGLWLGVYATWEGVVAQAIAAMFVVGSYYVAERVHRRIRGGSPAPRGLSGGAAATRAPSP